MDKLYLNGDFVPMNEAKVSIMDRGFLFGDGVYEVIPVYANQPFRLAQHLTRLQNSLHAIQLAYRVDLTEWKTIISSLIALNSHLGSEQAIYLQITRGVVQERVHSFSDDIKPTVIARSSQMLNQPLATLMKGKSAITLADTRWEYCYIKSIALLPNILLVQQAKQQGVDEAILIHEGYVTEGASSNFFMVKNKVLITPALNHKILGGITRQLILELAAQNHIPYQEREVAEAELATADEIWISSSTKEIFPIIQLNHQPVNQGQVGPLWHQMIQLYQEFKRELRNE